jgi:hypothetical protein
MEGNMRMSLRSLGLFLVSLAVVAAVPAHAGNPAGTGLAIASACVNLDTQTIVSFGGRGTHGATAGPTGAVGVNVFFDGRYPKNLAETDLVVQATADGHDVHAVANAVVSMASSSQIVVVVNEFTSNTGADIAGNVWVTVYLARVPDPVP